MANLLSWLGGAAKKVEQTIGGAVHGAEQAVQHAVQPVAQQVGQAVNNAGGQVNRAVQQSAPVVRNDAINILRGVTSAANNTAKFSNNTFAKPVFKGVQQVARNPLQAAGDALGAGVQTIPVVKPLVDSINQINTMQRENPKLQASVQQVVDQQKAIANKIPRINLQSNDPNQIVRGGLNMAAGIVNSTVNAPSDLAKATTGYTGNLLSQGTNHPDSFTKSLPNIAGSVEPILNVAGNFVGAGTAANLAKQGVEAVGKQGAKQVLVQGAKTGAKIGGQYGAASGALGALKDTQPNDNAGTIAGNTFMQAALGGATGAGAGAVLGAGGAGVGYGATKGVQGIKTLDKAAGRPLANEAGKSNLPTGGGKGVGGVDPQAALKQEALYRGESVKYKDIQNIDGFNYPLTSDKNIASKFAGQFKENGNLKTVRLASDTKVLSDPATIRQIAKGHEGVRGDVNIDNVGFQKAVRNAGYDAVDLRPLKQEYNVTGVGKGINESEVRVFNPSKVEVVSDQAHTPKPTVGLTPKTLADITGREMDTAHRLGPAIGQDGKVTVYRVGKMDRPGEFVSTDKKFIQDNYSGPHENGNVKSYIVDKKDVYPVLGKGGKDFIYRTKSDVLEQAPIKAKPTASNIPTIPGKGKVAPQPVSKTPQMIERIKNSPDTPAQVADSITGSYDVRANPETMAQAARRINDNPEAALAHVLSDKYRPTVEDHTTAMLLAEQARKAGNYDRMTSLLEKVGQNAHNPAQALQILSQWGKTTPEGIVKYAQKITRDAYPLPKDAAKAKLTADQAKYFSEAMQKINDMPEGRPKLIETAKLMKEVENLVPASAGHKLQNVLYYAQLLNPKTAIRNIVGNGIFGLGENLSDTIAAPIDATKSLVTGKPRSVYLPDIPGQLKAAYLGGRDAAQEAKAGVNLSGLSGQYGVANQTGTAFNNKGGRALDAAMSLELSAPDRAFYSAAEYQGVRNHLRSIGIDKRLITPENVWLAKQGLDSGVKIDNHSLEVASELGKYRTFQDDSVPATVLQAVKSGLNLKKEFGAGSFILNYPKTPGNLLARGLDFSPVGFLKATIDIGKLATGKEVSAGAVTRDISRALVGTAGLVGTGAALNSLGIITGRPDSNKSVSAAEKTLGLGAYKINTSALKRYVFSGLNPAAAKIRPGDTLISYDWAQPLAFSLTMGANLNETKGSSKGTVGKLSQSLGMGAGQVVDAMNSLAEQPVLQGLTKLSGGGAGVAQGVITAATSAPASFVPTLLNQINQLSNNQARSTYSPNPLESALKQVENKIPIVSNSLQPQVNTIGQGVERYQGGTNSPFNVLLNPSFVSKYTPQNVLDEVKRLQEATGETKQFPDLVKYTQKIDGKNVQLTPEQVTALQTKVGKNNAKYMQDIMNTPAYQNATDIQKVNMLSSVSTDVAAAGRRTVLGGAGVTGGALDVAKDQPIGTDKSQQQLVKNGKKVAKKTTAKKATTSKSTGKKVAKGKVAKAVKLPSYKTAKFATPRFKVGSPKKSTFSVKKLPKYGSTKTSKVKVV